MAENNKQEMSFGLWIAFGMIGGTIAGMLFLDNIGLGAAFGLSFGIMFGIIFSSQKSIK
ncbi:MULTISPECIES: hypothetical protein [unclassified Microbacterium]|uniref:hypothetical protein n=1 Tax=unclassified Microbacterium TaxID=2609290 RepID=UPI00036CA753|nr:MULTISPECIES: hypothetical protein [unclassified Microbacterium]SDG82000.1 hypothetical protein SAMN04488590_1868 [Microbacterium sp. 77mftsu3.1]